RAAGQSQGRARGRRPAGDPQGARPDRRQHLQRRQIARDQPPDALRSAQAIWTAGVMCRRLSLNPVRPELVEGLPFFLRGRRKGQGFDKLSPNGWGIGVVGALLLTLAACGGPSGTPYERGAAAFESGDIRTARVELLNALQQDPNNKAARIMQARVQLALGDGEAAEGEINRARQSGATLGQTAHLLAEARLLQGDAQGALREAAHAGQPFFAYAQRIAGRAYLALGDGSSARTAFDRALAAAPNDSDVWVDIAGFRR